MKLIINGANGRIGKNLCACISKSDEHSVRALIDTAFETNEKAAQYSRIFECNLKADAIIDFSSHFAVPVLCSYAVKTKTPLVIGTTGHTEKEKGIIRSASKRIPVFYSPNMSAGVSLALSLAQTAAKAFSNAEIDIVEKHHDKKTDIPSATALFLAQGLKSVRPELCITANRDSGTPRSNRELCIHSLRLGNSSSTHEIIFAMPDETVTIRHDAHDCLLFSKGALLAAEYLQNRRPGLYSTKDLLI